MEIEEEFISGFCRTMNSGETVCCEYTRREDGSRELTFMDCAHERCVNTGACEIFRQAGVQVEVEPVSSEAFPAKAKRPSNSRMSKDKLEQNGFRRLPAWQDAVGRYLKELGK